MQILLFLALSLLLPMQLLQGEAQVELIELIALKSSTITLGDIAHIRAENEERQQQLTQLLVDKLPNMETARVVSAFKVKKLLEQAQINDVTVQGMQSRAYLDFRVLPHTEVERIVYDWLTTNVASGVKVKVRYDRLPSTWKVPVGDDVVVEVVGSRNKLGGDMALTLKAMTHGRVMNTAHIRVHVDLFRSAVVATRPLARGEMILEQDIAVEKANITHSNGMEVVEVNEAVGRVSKKDIPAGSLIFGQDIELPVLVEKGSLNRILVVNGAVQMQLTGAKALAKGKKGDWVTFTNPFNSKTTLAALVVDKNVAMVDLG